MALDRIERVGQRRTEQALGVQNRIQQRLELYRSSGFERVGGGSALVDGKRIDLPHLSAEQARELDRVFSGLSSERQSALEAGSAAMASAIYAEIDSNPDAGLGRVSSALSAQAYGTFEVYMGTGAGEQQATALNEIMLGTMTYVESDIADFAYLLKARTDLKSQARTDSTELRDAVENWPDGTETQLFSWTEVRFGEGGTVETVVHTDEPLTKEQAANLANTLDSQVQSLSDITTMMQFDLQTATERYQQAVSVMSAIMKDIHDTASRIIGNVR